MSTSEDASQVAGILLIVLDIITVAGRFYSRWITKLCFGWDDWTILIALLIGIVPGALTMWASTISATGAAAASNLDPNHVYTPEDVLYTKITFSTTVLYFFITSITKISILLLFHRIFSISDSMRKYIYIGLAAVVAFWLSATIADLLNCIPLEWTWNNGLADPRYCISYNMFWLGTGIAESVIDLYILSLPLAMVSTLHLERNRKWGAAGIFLLGGFVLFSGVAKIILSYLPNSREPDFGKGSLWTTVHLYTGILCANLPTGRPLLNRVAQLTSASRTRLLSLSRAKRWYSLSGSQETRGTNNGATISKSKPGDGSQDSAPSGRDQYELPLYSVNSYECP
ncbi:hypothetical protein CC78DRAFT_210421 [Lojkania enalia]|uniref:Rhodopsin domain-containing protein n=1 Tax=Lojkania enalia TaxID=147567 RepID=A0A9P4MWW6_9PLEO|nr:hypothetical protein CC78DRAFT_210421 [Didymosphaeria enalia]